MHRLAEVDAVVEDLVDRALVDRLARPVLAVLRRPRFRRVAGAAQLLRQLGRRADAQEPLEDEPDELGFRLVHHQLAVAHVVAERRGAAHPHALAPRRGELVADALADHLALELGEAEQDVERQPAHRRRRVELLSYAYERNVMLVEYFDNPCEVGERAAQPVDLVDDDDVDDAALDIAQQPLQRRPLHACRRRNRRRRSGRRRGSSLRASGWRCTPAPPRAGRRGS